MEFKITLTLTALGQVQAGNLVRSRPLHKSRQEVMTEEGRVQAEANSTCALKVTPVHFIS